MSDIDMRIFASRAGTNVTFPAGSNVFAKGDPGNCMYVIQSGAIEIVIGDKVAQAKQKPTMTLANAIAIFAVVAYGVFFIAAYALPETRGRVLHADA